MMQLREPEWRRLEVNEVDLTALAQRLARSLGIEPYLESVFLPGDLEIGRFLVLMSLGVWALVLLTVMNTMLLRYILPKQSPGPNRERLVESARTLRRVGHRTRRTGYVMLLIGFLVALPLLLVGAKSRPERQLRSPQPPRCGVAFGGRMRPLLPTTLVASS